jgi:succinoglycan biosynthesis protein ExoH
MQYDDEVRRRISLLRFLMIFGVVLLHTPPYVPIAEVGSTPFDQIKAFFQHAVFRTTVPVLTCLSGYLLFRAKLDKRPGKLAHKKFTTIVVPFLFFNLLLLGAADLLENGLHMDVGADVPDDPRGWANAAFGLTGAPINYPLNFLRDLIALMLVAPLFGWMLRHCPWLGLGAVLLVFLNNLDGYFLLRDVMAPVFYFGGLAAVRRWNLCALDRWAPLCLAAFLVLCAAVVAFRVANTNYLRMAAPLLIWPAAALLTPTRVGAWLARMSKYSFFVFVAHAPVLLATWMAWQRLAPRGPYPLYWLLAPVATSAVLVLVYRLAMRWMPGLFSSLIGATPPPPSPALPGALAAAPAKAGEAKKSMVTLLFATLILYDGVACSNLSGVWLEACSAPR